MRLSPWNSFLDVTGVLLLVTCLFGRHFCGYACAFGSLGDALYEITLMIRQKVFHKKGRHGYSEKTIRILQKVKYIILFLILFSILMGCYWKASGYKSVGCFFHADSKTSPKCKLQSWNCIAYTDYDWHVYTGKIFLSISLPNGCYFCYNAYSAVSIV